MGEIEKYRRIRNRQKNSRCLDFRFEVPFKWYRVFPHLALTHLASFCKIKESSTMHSDLKLNRKRNFRFVRFLSLFPIFLFRLDHSNELTRHTAEIPPRTP